MFVLELRCVSCSFGFDNDLANLLLKVLFVHRVTLLLVPRTVELPIGSALDFQDGKDWALSQAMGAGAKFTNDD